MVHMTTAKTMTMNIAVYNNRKNEWTQLTVLIRKKTPDNWETLQYKQNDNDLI